jgi:hypothetical protein
MLPGRILSKMKFPDLHAHIMGCFDDDFKNRVASTFIRVQQTADYAVAKAGPGG